MRIKWLGHAAFLLTGESTQVVIDPYGRIPAGRGMKFAYPPLIRLSAPAGTRSRARPRLPRARRSQRDRRGRRRAQGAQDGRNLRVTGWGGRRRGVGARPPGRGSARGEHDPLLHARWTAVLPPRRLRPERAAAGAGRGNREGRRSAAPWAAGRRSTASRRPTSCRSFGRRSRFRCTSPPTR